LSGSTDASHVGTNRRISSGLVHYKETVISVVMSSRVKAG
jgi:hypothetical protein